MPPPQVKIPQRLTAEVNAAKIDKNWDEGLAVLTTVDRDFAKVCYEMFAGSAAVQKGLKAMAKSDLFKTRIAEAAKKAEGEPATGGASTSASAAAASSSAASSSTLPTPKAKSKRGLKRNLSDVSIPDGLRAKKSTAAK